MHLLIPFASALSDAASQVLQDLALPNLAALLQRTTPVARDDAEPTSLSAPHERAWAVAQGWIGSDGLLPFAAHLAAADGIDVGDAAWALVTPAHWHVGRDHVTMADPAALQLDAAESRAAFDALRELFESEGLRFAWGAPTRWYVAADRFAELPCASLDRVIGRNVEPWLQRTPDRLVRRLQSEAQLLLYPHALNEAREARAALPLNSFWLSGCGRAQPARTEIVVDDRLRAPLFAEDWVAWADAWRALDAGPIAQALALARAGKAVTLTLCGDRGAHSYRAAPAGLWQRIRQSVQPAASPQTALEAL